LGKVLQEDTYIRELGSAMTQSNREANVLNLFVIRNKLLLVLGGSAAILVVSIEYEDPDRSD
jgi:hypothetical protein